MRRRAAIGWLPALAWCAYVGAATPDIGTRIQTVYLELGRGDQTAAIADSAKLLADVPLGDKQRSAVLTARLDTLSQAIQLNKPAGEELHAAIDAYAAKSGDATLSRRFAIAQAYDRSDGAGALKLAQEAETNASKSELAELQLWYTRAAALGGHLPEGRAQALLALETWKKARGAGARWREIELDYYVGQIDQYTGSNESALRYLRDGKTVAIAAFGGDSNERFKIDTTLAGVLVDMGRNRDALDIRETLVGVAQHLYGSNSVQAAKAEAQLGAGLQEIGDYPTARAHYDHALKVLAGLPDTLGPDRGIISVNFGNLLQEMGELDASLVQYRSALELFGDRPETRHARAIVNADMGNTQLRLQHYDEAVADYKQAIELREQSDGKDNPGLAYSLEGLGSASLALRRGDEAERYFRRALSLRERALSPNHPTMVPLTFGVALALWQQNDVKGAFEVAVKAAQHQQTMLGTFAADFSERQSVAYREILMPVTPLAVTLAARLGDADSIATAWKLAMVERGLVARTEARRLAAARAANDPAIAAAFDAWRKTNSALGDAWLGKQQEPEKMQALTAATENAERALWRAAGQHGGANVLAVADLGALAQALPSDGMLIAYTEAIDPELPQKPTQLERASADHWYAFTLAAGGQPQLHHIGDIQELTAKARAWYVGLRNPKSDPVQLRSDGEALRRAAVDPLLAGTHAQHLFIVPEGELYRLSFAALPDAKQGYLVESGVRVHTLANEADVSLAALPADANKTLLAGAPDFAAVTGDASAAARQLCLRAVRDGFAPIPNAGRELDDLDALFQKSSTNPQVHLVRGAQATKQNVLAALPQANIVHLATHGFSLDESCAEPDSSRGVTLTAAPGAAQGSAVSGLAFSGASVNDSGAPVGVLSAGELATLDLSQVSWIALSACDSGLGPIGHNEGVFGMRRALRLAGARTVVMSLWQVDDAATADLMGALYRARFVEHADVPDAMASAMRSVIQARRAAGLSDHPYYWAAFIGEGGWR